jgi:hypothetical protein
VLRCGACLVRALISSASAVLAVLKLPFSFFIHICIAGARAIEESQLRGSQTRGAEEFARIERKTVLVNEDKRPTVVSGACKDVEASIGDFGKLWDDRVTET